MNQEIKNKWLEALRSGEYQQGKGMLKINNRFCCLGVLCDIHAKEIGNEWIKTPMYMETYMNQEAHLPREVIEWAELKTFSPEVNYKYLTDLNDGGKTFEEIADLIEKHL